MKLTLQISSWFSLIIGVVAVLGGFAAINNDPANAANELLGGLLFGTEGLLALLYVSKN